VVLSNCLEARQWQPYGVRIIINTAEGPLMRIEDYALIGDCETAALVSRAGSIDWLCWPRFDSAACFAALLGTPQHGRWLIDAVDQDARRSWSYRGNTLILETRIETNDGVVTVIDFMPPRVRHSNVVRLVRGERGRVAMRTELIVRFGYGRSVPWVTRLADGTFRAIAGPDMVVLRTPVALKGRDLTTVGEFTVEAKTTIPFVLTYTASHVAVPKPIDPLSSCSKTQDFWTEWVDRAEQRGEWSDEVIRSLITLKALTYAPTGGIVAAPTTSLPEQIGGTRNWDYRYCWVRDATLTLLALMTAGYYNEARAWRDWLLRAAAGAPAQMQIMYGLAGERQLVELELSWLTGYEDSRPVRIGNAGHAQLQLDVFGELMDALHQARRGGIHPSDADWAFQRELLRHLADVWNQPDHGIWEVRSKPRHFTYSKIMAWVALDRGLKAAEAYKLEGPIAQWRDLAHRIHSEVCAAAFDARRGTFVQSYGSTELDASLLLIPSVGFLPPNDPRVRGTVEAIEKHLLVDGLVRRYDTARTDDGLRAGEGVFLACSFWLADALLMIGREDAARQLFERLLALRTDLGLLSEEYDTHAGRLVGNFPQAFSHIALMNTAFNLTRASKPAEQRAAS
jgi:GH15 family glucan-1,4-alpha-glucosidase